MSETLTRPRINLDSLDFNQIFEQRVQDEQLYLGFAPPTEEDLADFSPIFYEQPSSGPQHFSTLPAVEQSADYKPRHMVKTGPKHMAPRYAGPMHMAPEAPAQAPTYAPEQITRRRKVGAIAVGLLVSVTGIFGAARNLAPATAEPAPTIETTTTFMPTTTSEATTTTIEIPTTTTTAEVVTTTTEAPVVIPANPVYIGSAAENQALAHQMASEAGLDGQEIACMDSIVARESSYGINKINDAERNNDFDRNKLVDFEAGEQISDTENDAYGIPQAKPGGKMASIGSDWRTNPATQISWMFSYVKGRYSSMCKAWEHKRTEGWY